MCGSLLLYPDTVGRVKLNTEMELKQGLRGPISKPITNGSVRVDCREEQVLAVCHGNPRALGPVSCALSFAPQFGLLALGRNLIQKICDDPD